MLESNSIPKYTKIIIVRLIKLKDEVEVFMFFLIEGESGKRYKRLTGNKFNLLIKDNIQINKCKKVLLLFLICWSCHSTG